MTDQSTIIPFHAAHKNRTTFPSIFFERAEFDEILNVYGKMVASGHWKDYAISASKGVAMAWMVACGKTAAMRWL